MTNKKYEYEKGRDWTFIVYPESAQENWREILDETHLRWIESPLHDKDLSDVEGQKYKKPHYHVIYVSKNPVTADSVRIKIKRALGDNSVALVQIIRTSIENTYLYLTHESKDAIEKKKHVYDKTDITLLSNFDIDRYITLDVEEKDDMLNEVCDLIDEYDIANMRELRRFVKLYGAEHGLPSIKIINSVLRSHTGLIRLYFDAVYQERKYGSNIPDVNPETGEILSEDSDD